MPAIEITAQEIAHHMAMLSRTYEVRRRLRNMPGIIERQEPPLAHFQPAPFAVLPAKPAPRKEEPRHPSDFVRYKFPLSLPDPDAASGRNKAKWQPVELMKQVAEMADLHPDILKSSTRIARVVRPRQFAMWLVKHRIPYLSLPQIGRIFGGRDHTTILHAWRKIDRLIREGVIDPNNPRRWMLDV